MSRHAVVLEKAAEAEALGMRASVVGSRLPAGDPCDFTNLIARLFAGPEPVRVVAFTSAFAGEGVTWTVGRVAEAAARITGRSTAIVPAEELSSSRGLHVLGTPSTAGASDRRHRLTEITRDAEIVLIDAGSLQAAGAVIGIAALADSVVVVVESGRTTKSDVARVLETVTAAGGAVAGLVLNKRLQFVPDWLRKLIG